MGSTGDPEFSIPASQRLYGETCLKLDAIVHKVTDIFPALEAVQPRKSGMQALCGLHWALDRAKSFLHQITHSSKLYLAITSDSVLVKFEKAKESLDHSLRRLESNVPEVLARQVALLVLELQETTFQVGVAEQEAGSEIVSLLQKEEEVSGLNALTEMDIFDHVALKLGITSGSEVLAEKNALRRLLNKARNEEDKKKELIVRYLLHLLRKYCKIHKFWSTEEESAPGMAGLCPPSPSERGSEASTSGRDSDNSSELCCFEVYKRRSGNCSKDGLSCLGNALIPPEEFRCPISLQLMSDPVIISSGQTYERVCIEKWFEGGGDTCPKTQQKLEHHSVTPNYCVKGLITSWCERHSIPIPSPPSPPPSPVANWRWDLFSESLPPKTTDDQSKVVTVSQNGGISADREFVGMVDKNDECRSVPTFLSINKSSAAEESSSSTGERNLEGNVDDEMNEIRNLIGNLHSGSFDVQFKAAEEVRLLTKDNPRARLYIGESGSIPALVGFLSAAIKAGDTEAQKSACLALLNVSVNNNRNKAEIVNAGVIPLVLKLLESDSTREVKEAAIVVLLTASCLDENKPNIGSSGVMSYLVDHLDAGSPQGVKDSLTTLYNLSICPGNLLCLVGVGIVPKLISLLSFDDSEITEKCSSVIYNLASIEEGRSSIAEAEGCFSTLAEILDCGTQKEKEHIAAIFLVLCTNSNQHSQSVLREGVIPSLVMLSVNGSARGKDKALKLLQHFREQRQKECAWHSAPQVSCPSGAPNRKEMQGRPDKSMFWRMTRSGSSFRFFRRSKSLSFYRC